MNSPRIAVLGLGNLMRTDDAVGMLAIQRLRADPRFPRSVSLIEGGTLGLDLLHPLDGVTHLLALDAIDAGATPGTLLRFADDAIADLPISKSVHLLGFSDLIGAAAPDRRRACRNYCAGRSAGNHRLGYRADADGAGGHGRSGRERHRPGSRVDRRTSRLARTERLILAGALEPVTAGAD